MDTETPVKSEGANSSQVTWLDELLLDEIFTSNNIVAVMHFSAFIAVGESVEEAWALLRKIMYPKQ